MPSRPRARDLRPLPDVWLQRLLATRGEQERVLAWVASALVRQQILRSCADSASWDIVDGVLRHASAAVRRSAVQALAVAWNDGGGDAARLSSRIALALLDPDERVWATAERARQRGWRVHLVLDLDDGVVAKLVGAVHAPEGSSRVGGVLADYVASSPTHAGSVS